MARRETQVGGLARTKVCYLKVLNKVISLLENARGWVQPPRSWPTALLFDRNDLFLTADVIDPASPLRLPHMILIIIFLDSLSFIEYRHIHAR